MGAEPIQILLIEDDSVYARFLKNALTHQDNYNYEVTITATLAAGLNVLSQHQFDVILLDVFLPDCQDATKELERFLGIAPQTVIIVLTAVGTEELGHYAIQHGAQDYLFKHQIDPSILARTIQYALERHQLWSQPQPPWQEALAASQRSLGKILEHTVEGVIIFDDQQTVVFANSAAETLYGRPLVGLTCTDIELPADFDTHSSQIRLVGEDQTETFAEWHVTDILWYEQPAYLVTVHDITDLHQQAQKANLQTTQIQVLSEISGALRASNSLDDTLSFALERIASIVNVRGGIFLLDERNNELVTRGWYPPNPKIIGLRKPVNTGLSGIVMNTGRPFFTDNLQEDQETAIHPLIHETVLDVRSTLILPILSQDKTIGTLHIGFTDKRPFTLDEMRIFTAIAEMVSIAIERINLLKNLEQRVLERTMALEDANYKLRQLDKLKTKFISDMSHELRTPVTTLRLHMDLLKRGREEKKPHYMAVMEKQIARLTTLADNILSLSLLDLTEKLTDIQFVDVNQIIAAIVALNQSRAEAQNLQLIFDPAEALPHVWGVPNHLSEAIMHLVDNAINYTEVGFVHISTAVIEDEIAVRVEDSGLGITSKEHELVFDRFYRGELVAQLSIPGTGLGLAIVRAIAQLHGGHVEIESTENIGSKFTIYLPLSSETIPQYMTHSEHP